ncbi:DgyrCDS4963 [Dimorphilus gyrociliatus]|uniref:DgyrCDS4963 n=1 Tax=Dimorphilus gyrociliatus TaxID=2664684 RepID=A0A7I8VJZ6_9ANNE|nr:DgyrCDS4963 [Dimorphilus gyrociliatus]
MIFDRRALLQFSAIFLLVPVQYLVTKYSSNTATEQTQSIKQLVRSIRTFSDKYLSLYSWKTWSKELILKFSGLKKRKLKVDKAAKNKKEMGGESFGQSPAVEVRKMKDPNGYFASSPEVRSPRPAHVKYRIGQVMKHKKWGYRGIIVGWDVRARAPEEWLRQMHPPDKPHWRDYPNYSIIVDTRDRPDGQTTYVAEENIEIVSNTKVMHPQTDKHFESWDGAQYIARPWLKELYPHD